MKRNCLECAVRGGNCFCSLPKEALVSLQAIGRETRFAAGERIVQEDGAADCVYVICSGRFKLTVSGATGRLLIVRIARPGDVLGLAAALKGGTHEAAAEALETCDVKVVRRDEFLKFMNRFQEVSRSTALAIARDYEGAMISVRRLALSGSAAQKLASTLLEWAGAEKRDDTAQLVFRMPFTHEELGNLAGISRETVTRLLSRFRHEGLLTQEGETMILRQPERIRTISASGSSQPSFRNHKLPK